MKYVDELLPVNLFSHCQHPLTARLSHYLDYAIDDVADEWGIPVWATSGDTEEFISKISTRKKAYMLCQTGEIKPITKTTTKKTGSVTWNGDDEYFQEFETIYEIGDTLDVVENFLENCKTKEGIDNIACQIINIISK